ncbi:Peptidase family M48 [Enhydrobacter aerosaccus]|uniref:Peptidase family M48 n=1 Tax=Enhydrobacter aerosaccus TaxID=225324 RepID=A0A1T4T5U3_9HYPH|nr:M48 family metallopeptidase [Enhydrobacter aerosaccus]SKA35538.1 Peptidase family M48 [Enhydrobacter aerosaccus]
MPAAPGTIHGRYYDGKSACVREVFVVTTPGEVILRDLGDSSLVARWPIVELGILGDSEHEAVPLLVRGGDEARLAIEDAEQRRQLATAVPEIAAIGARKPEPAGRILQWGGALVAAIGLFWFGIQTGSDTLAPMVPYGLQARLGESVYRAIAGNRPQCDGQEGLAAINQFANRVAAEAGYDHPISVRVLKGGPVNAFTLPGGTMILYGDLIALTKDGDELGGVIAHEIGHAVLYHPIKGLARQYGTQQILKALTGGYSDIGTLGSGGALLAALRNGRDFEREADEEGVSLLEKLGLHADGMSRFFEELLKAEPKDAAKAAGIWSDHPPTAERVEATKRPATGAPDFTPAEWTAIKSMCR